VQAVLESNGSGPVEPELTPFSAPGECRLRLVASPAAAPAQPPNASS
jgi:hypothetical protein